MAALQFPFDRALFADLADGNTTLIAVHTAVILWDGEEREVDVLATGNHPLLGTSLMDGYDLHIQFIEGGRAIINLR